MALLRHVGRSLQAAETQFLQAAGFAINNTFICEATASSPTDWEQQPLRRAVTMPLPKHEVLLEAKDEIDDDVSTAVAEDAASPSWADMRTEEESADSDSDATSGGVEDELTLSELVRRECAFLRIVSVSLVPLDATQSAKHSVKEVKRCLRVCVQGLPGQKRMKWQNPLAWSVALALQRAGRQAFVKRSKLYVLADAVGTEDSEAIVVDLCAPRSSELL